MNIKLDYLETIEERDGTAELSRVDQDHIEDISHAAFGDKQKNDCVEFDGSENTFTNVTMRDPTQMKLSEIKMQEKLACGNSTRPYMN